MSAFLLTLTLTLHIVFTKNRYNVLLIISRQAINFTGAKSNGFKRNIMWREMAEEMLGVFLANMCHQH